jgi:hypothetical protein
MQFSEDDLRTALERKEPGAGFTQRVMARISQAEIMRSPAAQKREGFLADWWKMPRPALAFALTVVLLAVGGWIGYRQYQQHVLVTQKEEALKEQERQETAARQAVLALRITSAKLNHVFQKVNGPQSQDEKTRRQTL